MSGFDEPVRLKTGVRLIPMINQWYTTPLLISPLTFGLITRKSHLRLLDSYIESPEVHRQCVDTPELRGGPFIDYAGNPADMAQFAHATLSRCAEALALADDIESLFRLVRRDATGASLGQLYAVVPARLRGIVELCYDVQKQPGVRFIESSVYHRAGGHRDLQSGRLEPVDKRERPFFLSTPLLERQAASVDLQAPFATPLWDTLFASRELPWGDWLAMLEPHLQGQLQDRLILADLFTQEPLPPAVRVPVTPGTVRVRYFGHACVLVESATTSVLIDPLVSYPGESDVDHFTFDDLPERIDYVLITHAHVDHFVLETLLQLRHKAVCVVVGHCSQGNLQDVSLKLALKHCGFGQVIEIVEHEELRFAGGRIVAAPFYGEHADLDIRSKRTFAVVLDEVTCGFFADSNPPHPDCYRSLREMLPGMDCLFLGMECVGAPASWSYGPLLLQALSREEDQSRRLNGSDANTAEALQQFFEPRYLFVYAMGAEPWVMHLSSIVYSEELPQFREARLLESRVRSRGRHAEVLYGKKELLLDVRRKH